MGACHTRPALQDKSLALVQNMQLALPVGNLQIARKDSTAAETVFSLKAPIHVVESGDVFLGKLPKRKALGIAFPYPVTAALSGYWSRNLRQRKHPGRICKGCGKRSQ